MKKEIKSLTDKSKDILNDNFLSEENIIYDEAQVGPMEEPYLFEYSLDFVAWSNYLKSLDKKNWK